MGGKNTKTRIRARIRSGTSMRIAVRRDLLPLPRPVPASQ